jgi:hypothetical protein
MSNKINRRLFLRGMGATAVALPLLPSLSQAAENEQFPKRIVFFYSPNGTIANKWSPTGGERNFQLSEILSPLAPIKDDVVIVEGVDNHAGRRENSTGGGHPRGTGSLLVGRPLNRDPNRFQNGGWASGISLDQFIANKLNLGQKTQFASLQVGVRSIRTRTQRTMSYGGSDAPIFPESDPYALFDRVFADVSTDQAELERLRAQRRSVLDRVSSNLGNFKQKVGAEDRQRIEAHLSSVRNIEQRLSQPPPSVQTCDVPSLGQRIDFKANDNMPTIGKLQMDLLAHSLQCDQTRVATLQFSTGTSNVIHSWLGQTGTENSHHRLSHSTDNASARRKIVAINKWYCEQFAYFVQKLKAIPEGSGTLLDNTLVVYLNELGKGRFHTTDDLPIVMAGKLGGLFETGRYVQYGNVYHNDFLLTLAKAMDVDVSSFGDRRFSSGSELSGLMG